jgi:hypothetical protein
LKAMTFRPEFSNMDSVFPRVPTQQRLTGG